MIDLVSVTQALLVAEHLSFSRAAQVLGVWQSAVSRRVRALEDKPKHIGTPIGTVAEVANAVAPKVVDAVLHTAYLLFPDSTAAGGGRGAAAPEALSRGAVVLSRLLPGVHW